MPSDPTPTQPVKAFASVADPLGPRSSGTRRALSVSLRSISDHDDQTELTISAAPLTMSPAIGLVFRNKKDTPPGQRDLLDLWLLRPSAWNVVSLRAGIWLEHNSERACALLREDAETITLVAELFDLGVHEIGVNRSSRGQIKGPRKARDLRVVSILETKPDKRTLNELEVAMTGRCEALAANLERALSTLAGQ